MNQKLIIALLAVFTLTIFSIMADQLPSHAENVQIIFDPIFGHNHNGTNSAKLATNSVNTTQLVDNSVTSTKISGPISVAKGGTGLTSLGSANQILRVNSGGTALEYAASSSGIGQDGDMNYKLSKTIGDYAVPSSATASSEGINTPNFEDLLGSSTGWTQTGTATSVTGGEINTDGTSGGTDRVAKDHGLTLGNTFVFEFEFTQVSGDGGNNIFIAISSHDTHFVSTTGTKVAFKMSNGYAYLTIRETSSAETADTSMTFTDGTKYYGRIIRTGASTWELKFYTDSARTSQYGSTLSVSASISNTLGKIVAGQMGDSLASKAKWDALRIYNGTTVGSNTYSASRAIDGSTTNEWRSVKENKPWIRLDLGANKDLASSAISLERTNTNATSLKIYASTDTTFTSGEVIAFVNVTDFTDDTWRFIQNNRLPENSRYVLIEAQENSCVLALNEVKYREITDWSRHFHVKRDVTTTNSFNDSN